MAGPDCIEIGAGYAWRPCYKMGDTMNVGDLAKEFPKGAVHWRVQGKPYQRDGAHYAMALAYIDARDVMDRLDDVCGPENWQAEYSETPTGRVICRIGIKIYDGTSTANWVWKADGAGSTQVEGEKGGISDALKRAAVAWGIGRYLYRLDSPWVKCDINQKNGNTYWKRWAEDPWSKVKNVGYQQPKKPDGEDEEKPEPKAPEKPKGPTARDVADKMIAAMKGAPDYAKWSAIANDPKFIADLKRLDEVAPPMAGEVRKAQSDAKLRVDPAGQAPAQGD